MVGTPESNQNTEKQSVQTPEKAKFSNRFKSGIVKITSSAYYRDEQKIREKHDILKIVPMVYYGRVLVQIKSKISQEFLSRLHLWIPKNLNNSGKTLLAGKT